MRFALLLLTLLPGIARADWHSLDSRGFSVNPPPMQGSSDDQRDVETVLRTMGERGREGCPFYQQHSGWGFDALWDGNPVLTGPEMSRLAGIMDDVVKVAGRVARGFKDRYNRPRPFTADARVRPCIPPPNDGLSYPSGHATAGAAVACVLAKLYPYKADALLRYGEQIGDYRIAVGVHFPTDVVAGKKLGREVCEALYGDAQFRGELERLR